MSISSTCRYDSKRNGIVFTAYDRILYQIDVHACHNEEHFRIEIVNENEALIINLKKPNIIHKDTDSVILFPGLLYEDIYLARQVDSIFMLFPSLFY